MRYPAVVDGKPGAYGVTFPGLPVGGGAMGATIEEALINAADVLRDMAELAEAAGRPLPPPRALDKAHPDFAAALAAPDAFVASVPLMRADPRPVKANLSIERGVLAAIDAEAARQKLTRSALIEAWAKEALAGKTP